MIRKSASFDSRVACDFLHGGLYEMVLGKKRTNVIFDLELLLQKNGHHGLAAGETFKVSA